MALPAPPSPALDSRPAPFELLARGEWLLAVGDLDGYRELFLGLAAIDDPHRRHWAAVSLLERGAAQSAGLAPPDASRLLGVLATAVVELLEREPCEPVLLQRAGSLFTELGSLAAARALLEAAQRLDPHLDRIERELEAIHARERVGEGGPRFARRELSRRALEVAARARPAEGLRLSLCMIVRDEQEMLPGCLAAVADVVDELVVVDTGSVDRTVEIARSFGALVIEHEWSDSFAEARNLSFDAASGDWLMYLDADEVLVREDAELLRSLTGRTWREAFYLSEINYTGTLGDGAAVTHEALRIFRNRPEYRFEGRVHEQIAHRLPTYLPERLEASAVRVEHYGYLLDVRARRKKSTRNIELLRLAQAEQQPSAFMHHNLGTEYAAAGDALQALAELERAWSLLRERADLAGHEFAPAVIAGLVRALRACGRPAEAFAEAQDGLARFPDFTDLVLEQALAARELAQHGMARELLEHCLELGDAPRRYAPRVGCGSHLALRELMDLHLSVQDFTAFERLLSRFEHTEPPARERSERLAEMYLRHGYAASAAEEWMAICRHEPDVRALSGLARVAASRGMRQEAEEFAAAARALEGVTSADRG
ncbi:MAG TPA: glycosyltransferase [Solirubrobacteraceae bacterium]|nr:glycosyltransferase [Solirubrobacteraceae bacterium]